MNYKFVAMKMTVVLIKVLIKIYRGRRQTIDCVSLFFAPENFLDRKLPEKFFLFLFEKIFRGKNSN